MNLKPRFFPLLSSSVLALAVAINCGGSDSPQEELMDDGDGGSSPGGAKGDAGAGNDSASNYCRSDKECRTAGKLCDSERHVCVECLETTDCGDNQLCRRNSCVEITPCKTSKNCDADQICAESLGYCVDCEGDNDCGADETCAFFSCLPSCKSDKNCSALGMVCLLEESACVDCVQDRDCNANQNCNEAGDCVDNVCSASEQFCNGDTLTSCAERGTGFVTTICTDGCKEDDDEAACMGKNETCTTGDDGCECYPNNTCNKDLECLNNRCFDAVAGSGGMGSGGSSSTGGSSSGGNTNTGGSSSGGNTNTGGDTGAGGTVSANCLRLNSATAFKSTTFPSPSIPYEARIPAVTGTKTIGYDWVGWFDYNISLPSTDQYTISVRVADDGWKEGTANEVYNHFTVQLDGITYLEFNGTSDSYDDETSPMGNRAFHTVTSNSFNANAGGHILRIDNLVDQWTDGDDMGLYIEYIDICWL